MESKTLVTESSSTSNPCMAPLFIGFQLTEKGTLAYLGNRLREDVLDELLTWAATSEGTFLMDTCRTYIRALRADADVVDQIMIDYTLTKWINFLGEDLN